VHFSLMVAFLAAPSCLSIGHVSPEAAGGAIGLVQKHEGGDWVPVEHRPRVVSTALKTYAKMATSADKGAVRDLSRLD